MYSQQILTCRNIAVPQRTSTNAWPPPLTDI